MATANTAIRRASAFLLSASVAISFPPEAIALLSRASTMGSAPKAVQAPTAVGFFQADALGPEPSGFDLLLSGALPQPERLRDAAREVPTLALPALPEPSLAAGQAPSVPEAVRGQAEVLLALPAVGLRRLADHDGDAAPEAQRSSGKTLDSMAQELERAGQDGEAGMGTVLNGRWDNARAGMAAEPGGGITARVESDGRASRLTLKEREHGWRTRMAAGALGVLASPSIASAGNAVKAGGNFIIDFHVLSIIISLAVSYAMHRWFKRYWSGKAQASYAAAELEKTLRSESGFVAVEVGQDVQGEWQVVAYFADRRSLEAAEHRRPYGFQISGINVVHMPVSAMDKEPGQAPAGIEHELFIFAAWKSVATVSLIVGLAQAALVLGKIVLGVALMSDMAMMFAATVLILLSGMAGGNIPERATPKKFLDLLHAAILFVFTANFLIPQLFPGILPAIEAVYRELMIIGFIGLANVWLLARKVRGTAAT